MHVRYFREVWEWGHCSSVRWCMCLAEGPMSIFNNVQNFPSPFSFPSLICLGPHAFLTATPSYWLLICALAWEYLLEMALRAQGLISAKMNVFSEPHKRT